MSRRAAICLLASVVSLVATQTVVFRTESCSEPAAIMRLAQTRPQKAVKREAAQRKFRSSQQNPSFSETSYRVPQNFFGCVISRAPPVSHLSAAL